MTLQTTTPSEFHISDVQEHGIPALISIFFRYRWTISLAVVVSLVAAIVYWIVAPPVYRAEALCLPSAKILGDDESLQMGALQSAALSLGVSVSGGKADPALLYGEVLKSRSVIQEVLLARVSDSNGDSVVVLDALGIRGHSEVERLFKGTKHFRRDMIRISADVRTGIIKISVAADDPVVAAGLANLLVVRIDSFNQIAKASSAGRQVEFIDDRLHVVESSLQEAETILEQFRSANRVISASPELVLKESRLERDVRLNEQLYLTLRTQRELAKIEEVKRFPVVVSIDEAIPPPFRESPRLGRTLVLFAMLALVVALVGILVADGLKSSPGNPLIAQVRSGMAEDRRRLKFTPRR
jgi:uncharacterized protein involved in exopolysaccharide biosynthesis